MLTPPPSLDKQTKKDLQLWRGGKIAENFRITSSVDRDGGAVS